MINWKVRFKNPVFVITTAIPGALILIQMILAFVSEFITPIGFQLSNEAINGFMGIVNLFALTFLGIGAVVDPTTKQVSDSERVMNRDEPV